MDSPVGFGSDNHSGVHPKIIKTLLEINHGHQPSYGTDQISQDTVQLFRAEFGTKDLDVHFVFNGTAANVLCLKPFVKSYQAILCSNISHLFLDECGAPEALIGCKLIPVESRDGKLNVDELEKHMIRRGDQHFSQIAALSITQPTEVGTVYTLEELRTLREWARAHKLYFHIDGARLANAIVYLKTTFQKMVTEIEPDCLSFGGTKNGLMGVEAVLFFGPNRPQDFKFIRKQALQLPSKTRFLAVQMQRYLSSHLWREIAEHSLTMAQRLANQIAAIPEARILYPVQSNAVFVNIPRGWAKAIREKFFFYVWDEHTWDLRWMTTFDTQVSTIDNFIQYIHKVRNNEIPTNFL